MGQTLTAQKVWEFVYDRKLGTQVLRSETFNVSQTPYFELMPQSNINVMPDSLLLTINTLNNHDHIVVLLAAGDIDSAWAEIKKNSNSTNLDPDIKFLRAICNYYKAYVYQPTSITMNPPEAITFNHIRQDEQSQESLRFAGLAFEELSGFENLKQGKRIELLLWQLACLASNSNQQSAADTLCQTILQESPGNTVALNWGVLKGYDVARSIQELAQKLNPPVSLTEKDFPNG